LTGVGKVTDFSGFDRQAGGGTFITVVMNSMALARSRLTAQGQISVPAEVRRKLGVGPGSVLEWVLEGDRVVVRRLGKHSLEDVHRVLFPNGPPRRQTLTELKRGLKEHARRRHARR
jgi:AbrB family looped-hinge helix DNA binding protein